MIDIIICKNLFPLIHFLERIYFPFFRVKKVYELEKLLAKEAATLPPAIHQQQQQHLERIKKLTDDLADLKAEKGKLLNRVEVTLLCHSL